MRCWWVGGLAAGLATAGVVAMVRAAIPDASGVIHACYRSNGSLRLVDKSTCAANETALIWNQNGPPGVVGPEGAPGPQGLAVPQGPAGLPGVAGPQGISGRQGAQGSSGPSGLAGVSGYEIVDTHGTLPPNGSTSVVATCPAGKRVLGGGYVVPSALDRHLFRGRKQTMAGASILKATAEAV
jgi:hypothetical protein